MRRRILKSILFLTIGVLGLALTAPASAATKTWVGNSGGWDNANNWDPTGQPENDDTVNLTPSDTTDRTVDYLNSAYPSAVLNSLKIDATGSGTMTLRQGQDPLSAMIESIGDYGTGAFTQTGGSNALSGGYLGGVLYLGKTSTGNGTYDLSGTGNLSADTEYIGYSGTGTFTQTGGTNNSTHGFGLGWENNSSGTYDLSGGSISISLGEEFIGRWSAGTFIQSGGSNNLPGGILYLGFLHSNGTYDLSGGSLLAGEEDISTYGTGTFTQTGGSNTISTNLYLGGTPGSNGTYSISAGNLEVKDFSVGMISGGSGTLKITDPAANITVSDKLSFGPDSTFIAVPGATIHMTGSAFENKSTDPTALTGLSHLELVFEGGNADIDPFEVAGKDLGAVMAGFDNNFALGTLTLGGTDIGNIKLSDLFDNQPGWTGNEALYVYNLNIGAGSDLNLNGLNLYYLNGSINGNANIFGGSLTPIPEPSTLLLLGSGLVGLIRLRRKKLMS